MDWRVAKALESLLSEINTKAPNRSKVSDGAKGDAAHASRDSDHNPWAHDSKGQPIVTARDFTHDPAGGLDGEVLANALVASRDPRIKYVIWNRRIISSKQQPWVWRPYNGQNAHKHHVHVSVMPEEKLFDDASPWNLNLGAIPSQPKSEFAELRLGSRGDKVRALQQKLGIKPDGIFGNGTQMAVIRFQQKHNLTADGIVGPKTAKAMGLIQ